MPRYGRKIYIDDPNFLLYRLTVVKPAIGNVCLVDTFVSSNARNLLYLRAIESACISVGQVASARVGNFNRAPLKGKPAKVS